MCVCVHLFGIRDSEPTSLLTPMTDITNLENVSYKLVKLAMLLHMHCIHMLAQYSLNGD